MSKIGYATKCRYCGADVVFITSTNPLKKKPNYCCDVEELYVKVYQTGGKLYVTKDGQPVRGKELGGYQWDEDGISAYRVHWCDKFPGRNDGNNRKRR